VPETFDVPTELETAYLRLVPLGPEHSVADHAEWTSSIEHTRATPGFEGSSWPPVDGMSLDDNLADLRRHADDFVQRKGFTYTVLEPDTDDVIGCVYIYPSKHADRDVDVHSWVRANRAQLDAPLATTVSDWLATDWPLGTVHHDPR